MSEYRYMAVQYRFYGKGIIHEIDELVKKVYITKETRE
jgi:hypothetical protein